MVHNPIYQAANHRSGSQKLFASAYGADAAELSISMSTSVRPLLRVRLSYSPAELIKYLKKALRSQTSDSVAGFKDVRKPLFFQRLSKFRMITMREIY